MDWGHTNEKLGIAYYDRHAQAEKAANVARHQDWRTVFNSAVMCILANVEPQMAADLINAACGYEWTIEDMMKSGERGWNLKRAINNRMGLIAANDMLPKALLEPYKEGGAAGFVPDFRKMINAYYEASGWDVSTEKPTIEKLIELGLDNVAKEL